MHYLNHLARLSVPDIHPGGAAASQSLVEALAIADARHILELGCGSGKTLQRLAHFRNVTVTGIDSMADMVRAAQRRLGRRTNRCSLVQADAGLLPFANESFDRVYAESVIGMHDSTTIRQIFGEVSRVLKPGGLLVINEAMWKSNVSSQTVREVCDQSQSIFGSHPASVSAWHLGHWLDELERAGLKSVSWEITPTGRRKDRIKAVLQSLRRHWLTQLSERLRSEARVYRKQINVETGSVQIMEARMIVAQKPEPVPGLIMPEPTAYVAGKDDDKDRRSFEL
jgi:SAM-dependent methyltransferase